MKVLNNRFQVKSKHASNTPFRASAVYMEANPRKVAPCPKSGHASILNFHSALANTCLCHC